MATNPDDQVTINMDNLNPSNAKPDAVNTAIDGRRSGHRRHGSHGSGSGSHHHSYYSGESDTEDTHHSRHNHSHSRRRSRSRSRSRSPSPGRSNNRGKRDVNMPATENDTRPNIHDVEPLLTEKRHRVSHNELDEESDDNVGQNEQNPGVDGFLTGRRKSVPDNTDDTLHPNNTNHNNGMPTSPTTTTAHENRPPFPFSPLHPNVIYDANGNPQVIPDINVYQQKKNLAQGMMDLALLSANANQLRYVVETQPRHPYYWFSLVFISVSLILQVAVGVGLILNSRYNVTNQADICRADKINNFTIIGIFLITTVNVFITAFGVADVA